MTLDKKINLDPELKNDLIQIIQTVETFASEKESILMDLLKQKQLPELFEDGNN